MLVVLWQMSVKIKFSFLQYKDFVMIMIMLISQRSDACYWDTTCPVKNSIECQSMIESESHNLRLNMLNSLNTFKTFWLSEEAKSHYLVRTCVLCNVWFSDDHVFNRRHIIDERCRETLTMSFVNCNKVSR